MKLDALIATLSDKKFFSAKDEVQVINKRLIVSGANYLATIDLADGEVRRERIDDEAVAEGVALKASEWVNA